MMDKNIAIMLAEIQLASDNGKGLNVTRVNANSSRWQSEVYADFVKLGELVGESKRIEAIDGSYDLKNKLLTKACRRIAREPECGFRFWVSKDEKNIDVLFFQWKLEGKKHQCSFHRPEGAQNWASGSVNTQCRWEPGLSSRKELITLLESL